MKTLFIDTRKDEIRSWVIYVAMALAAVLIGLALLLAVKAITNPERISIGTGISCHYSLSDSSQNAKLCS